MTLNLRPALLFFLSFPLLATVQINANRVIYNGAQSDAKVTLKNTEQREYLIQSWIDNNLETKTQMPFIVTPPLFKMTEKSENLVKIIYSSGNLPGDRESLYWLNIKAIPAMTASEKSSKDKIVVAVVNRLKLLYRPSGLPGTPQQAIENLTWVDSDRGTVTANNNSPYYVILNKIELNGHAIEVNVSNNNTVIPPFSNNTYSVPYGPVIVNWSGLNDYGVASATYSTTLH